MAEVLKDSLDRPLRNLRLSVTDRCNLRCSYCMPEPDYVWLPREDILHFEEIETLVDVFTSLGVDKVRLTGGEPLLRRNLPDLIQRLAARPSIRDLAMTTNGVLLAANAQAIRDAGLHRLTVSLDTLRPQRFRDLTRYDELNRVLEGIDAAAPLFPGLKIDTVVIRGVDRRARSYQQVGGLAIGPVRCPMERRRAVSQPRVHIDMLREQRLYCLAVLGFG